jgi:hypothetical protein
MRTIAIVGLFLLPLAAALAESPTTPRIGERFPILTLPSLADGTALSVARFRGRKLLVHQFASW